MKTETVPSQSPVRRMLRMAMRAATAGLLLLPPCVLRVRDSSAQSTTAPTGQTAVSDTVLTAQGAPAQGTVLISWPTFTTASGIAVQQGSTSVALAPNGGLSVSLAPDAGATPLGSFYTVVYHLSDGTVTREYWQVPVSTQPVTLAQVRTSTLPSTVAVQTVTKQYVDQAIARAAFANTSGTSSTSAATPAATTSPYVLKTGDTMTGALNLPGDPTTSTQAADKNYVDENTAALQAGLNQKVSKVPTATQVVTQPASTELRTNRLNGQLYAQEFQSLNGNDGIANAFAQPECTGGCSVIVDPDYTGNDFQIPKLTGAHLIDRRNGAVAESFFSVNGAMRTITANFTQPAPVSLFSVGERINHTGYTGGNNLFPGNYGFTLPYFKSTYSATDTNYAQYTQGQHVMQSHHQDCYGVGDCIANSYYMRASGGFRDAADEGSHPADLQYAEDNRVFLGNCTSGCTAGSTTLQVTASANGGTQGSGRFLIDTAASKVITTGQLVGGNPFATPAATAQFSGVSFPATTFFSTAAAIPPQSNVMAPGTVTVAIQTTGVPSNFSTNTAASPAGSGVACIADSVGGGGVQPANYEMANFTVIDGTHLQLTLNKPHGPAAVVAIGGMCGYGLEQTVDTYYGVRQVFPIIGTADATDLYVASGSTDIVGRTGSNSAFTNLSYPVSQVQRSNGVVTVTLAVPSPVDTTGTTMTLSGVNDSSFNGSFAVTLVASNQYQFAQSGPNASSTGGNIQLLTGGYVLYPMAETLDVYDPATGGVTGKFTLAPNTVQWATNDPVEQSHYFQEKIAADVEYITQYTPRPGSQQQAGIYYQGTNGPGLRGWVISNVSYQSYLGAGGTHSAPDIAIQSQGVWGTALDVQAGENTTLRVHCNSKGCGRFNSTYNLFEMDTNVGGATDRVTYAPQNNTMTFMLGGTPYTLNPNAMTVGTLNVTNLNATHINGGSGGSASAATSTSQGVVQLGPSATSAVLANVATSGSASDLTSGTISPSLLPSSFGSCTATVAFSPTPAFPVTCSRQLFHFAWTGNVSSLSFSGLQAGQRITVVFQVGGAGGWSLQWPSGVHGGFQASTTAGSPLYASAGKYFVQEFVVDTDGTTLLNPQAVNQ